jgi:hypothetical protein
VTRKSLADARRLFRARKYTEVIRLLEPEVFRYRDNHEYFQLLGFSCLHAGDLGGAGSYITRAHQLKPGDSDDLLGLAAIQLKKADSEGALRRWLEVLDEDPRNAVARRGMEMLRRGLPRESLQELIDSGRIRQLYPPRQAGRQRAALFGGAALALIVLASGLAAVIFTRENPPSRPQVATVGLPEGAGALTEHAPAAAYTLTDRQVRESFGKIKSLLLAFRDNLAVVEANRLILSNASAAVKEKARLLKGYAVRPSFTTVKDTFPYAAVAREPALYDGCAVVWRGKIANLVVSESSLGFDMLVGYETERELKGVVPVTLDFAVQLENEVALEILGIVSASPGRLALAGISLHRLSSP